MQIRWTDEAAEDLREIVDYIAESSPGAARRIAREIHRRVNTLVRWNDAVGSERRMELISLCSLRCPTS